MNTQHTLGPWIPTQLSRNKWQIVANSPHVSGLTQTVCELNGPWKKENYEANARLIASAPELFEALEALLYSAEALRDEVESHDGFCAEPPSFSEARAAIAKAKGQA